MNPSPMWVPLPDGVPVPVFAFFWSSTIPDPCAAAHAGACAPWVWGLTALSQLAANSATRSAARTPMIVVQRGMVSSL
jgi:hypothetical protein